MANDLYGFEEEGSEPEGRDNLFIWTVFILLLIGLALACWMGSFYIFGHPEQPRAYKILKKLGKIEPLRRFEDIAAPVGEFLSPQKLFQRYSKFSRLELERENAALLRNYLNNFRETKKLVPYVSGNFTIMTASELTASDFFSQGMVALAQSNEFPQVLLEHVYPMTREQIQASRALLLTGYPIKLKKTEDLGAVIHVAKIADGRLQLTVVPLLYGHYGLQGSVGTFRTETPRQINIDAGLPVTRSDELEKADKIYADHRRTQPASIAIAHETGSSKGPEIVRLDAIPEGVKVPPTGALPEMPVATPIPLAGRTTPRGSPNTRPVAASTTPRASPRPDPLAMNATPRPAMNPGSIAMNTTPRAGPAPSPLPIEPPEPAPATPIPEAVPLPRLSPSGVPLKPFIASNPAPGPSGTGGSWRTYEPGRQPAAPSLTPADTVTLADRGAVPAQRMYLNGQFIVTASGENRAILRSRVGSAETPVRVIVEYPSGAVPPAEGRAFDRDQSHPFEIVDIRRAATGEVNVWVREIIVQ